MRIVRIIDFTNGEASLASRLTGAHIRNYVEQLLEEGVTVVLDFSGVDLITQSFGDELLGVLVRQRSYSEIKGKVKIKNANSLVKEIIKFVLSYSREAVVA